MFYLWQLIDPARRPREDLKVSRISARRTRSAMYNSICTQDVAAVNLIPPLQPQSFYNKTVISGHQTGTRHGAKHDMTTR